MVSPVPAGVVPPATTDSSALQSPEATRLGAYEQAWQQGSPAGQAGAHGSPTALGNDAMVLMTRFQTQLETLQAELGPTGTTDTTPAPTAASASRPAAQSSADPKSASLRLVMETFDFAVQEHLITQAATQLTGSVNTLVRAQ